MRTRAFGFFLSIVCACVAPVAAQQRTPHVAWQMHPGFRDVSFLAKANGLVVAGNATDEGYLIAFDPTSGKIVWRTVVGQMVDGRAPAIDAGVVYGLAGRTDTKPPGLFAVSLASGKQLWRLPRVRDMVSMVTPAGGKLYYATSGGGVAALDARTGKTLWKRTFLAAAPAGRFAWCGPRPIVAGGVVYAAPGFTVDRGPSSGIVVALDAAGAEKWRVSPDAPDRDISPTCYRLTLAGDALIVNGKTMLHALDAAGGSERWKIDLSSQPADSYNPWGVVDVTNDRLLVLKSTMRSYDIATGAMLWDVARESNHVAAANGMLYFNWSDETKPPKRPGFGWIYALDLATQRIAWKIEVADDLAKYGSPYWAPSALLPVEGGLLYNTSGKIVRINY